jgi:hypothetical protein
MKTMTKREAAHTSALLWATAAREPVYILEKGRPRYRVEAIDGDIDPLAELDRRGLLTRAAANPRPFTKPSSRRYTTDAAAAVLDDLRAER